MIKLVQGASMSKIIYDISLFTIYKVSIHIFSPIQSDVCIFQENLEILLEICLKRPVVGRDRDSPEVLRSACNQVISEDILLREMYCLLFLFGITDVMVLILSMSTHH